MVHAGIAFPMAAIGALLLSGCNNATADTDGRAAPQTAPPVAKLLASANGAACAHPEVIKVASDLLRKMPEDGSLEGRLLGSQLKGQEAKNPPMDLKLDRISLVSGDKETQTVRCSAVAMLSFQDASLNEAISRPEKPVSYTVTPSLDETGSFIVEVRDSMYGEIMQAGTLGHVTLARQAKAAHYRANGPAFDCMLDVDPMSEEVCDDPALSKLDRELAARLDAKVTAGQMVQAEADKAYQDWYHSKHYGCDYPSAEFKSCLAARYQAKIAEVG